jgi:hypothetical protein
VRAAEADAEGRRIGAAFGLGDYLRADDGSKSRVPSRIAAIILMVILPWYAMAFEGMKLIASAPGSFSPGGRLGSGVAVLVISAGIGVPLVVMLVRKRAWLWLYAYDEGVALMDGRGRPSVVRWSDLASMRLGVVRGYDGDEVTSCELRDRTGTTVRVAQFFNALVIERVAAQAELFLGDRLVGALTSRLDAGLPVTVGCLTVDQSGISCRGRNNWSVSWPEVQGVETQLHGHRVTVQTSRWRSKRAALDGQPNDFLARYALEHAARRAGVPFSAG